MPVPLSFSHAARALVGALLSALLFTIGLLCTPVREQVARRSGAILDHLLGRPASSPSPPPAAGEAAVSTPALPIVARPSAPRRAVAALPIAGIWHPSGWMGDAENPEGPLR